METTTFAAVDEARWPDLCALFEAPGGPHHCWCMPWRLRGAQARDFGAAERRGALERLVRDGVPVGILAYRDGRPVGWCSLAPRPTHRPLGGIEVPGEDGDRVWSLTCLYVPRALRGQGLGRALIAAAVEHARARGAVALEAYPVDPDSPSYRHMGFVPVFEAAGFRHVGRAGSRRHVMRHDLRGPQEPALPR